MLKIDTDGRKQGWMLLTDTETEKTYNLTYNSGIDIILVTENRWGSYIFVDYIHGAFDIYTDDELLYWVGHYINHR